MIKVIYSRISGGECISRMFVLISVYHVRTYYLFA